MNNVGLRSESTGNNYKKVEKMCSGCSEDTGVFPNINEMERSDIEGSTGIQLVTSLKNSVTGCSVNQLQLWTGKIIYTGVHNS